MKPEEARKVADQLIFELENDYEESYRQGYPFQLYVGANERNILLNALAWYIKEVLILL